jgi:hypothetical protein
MVDLAAEGALEIAAWKIKNLEDYDARLARAARRVEELLGQRRTAALVIYEAALAKSPRPQDEVRAKVHEFEEAFEDEEELTIPRVSGIMNVEGVEWFFGDQDLRVMTGQLLGQFQHRVAQYNYVNEREVLRRWADGYDTRLFIRRRIYETEPVVGIVVGFDLPLVQYLRVLAGGDTVVPDEEISRALVSLGALNKDSSGDDYAVLAAAEGLALRLELPAPVTGEMLRGLSREGHMEFPEPPSETPAEPLEKPSEGETAGHEYGEGGTEKESARPSLGDRDARRTTREEADRGEDPTRVQDPQAKDAEGVHEEEGGEKHRPAPPQAGSEDAPGTGR